MRNVTSDAERLQRLIELKLEDKALERNEDEAARENRNFTQVYNRGWRRIRGLIKENPSAALIYSFLAENIEADVGAVVVSQAFLATEFNLHERTVRRATKYLEDAGALVRIRVSGTVYAYALDPGEIWKSWDRNKDRAAFVTRTLVRKSDRENNQVNRRLKLMVEGPPDADADAISKEPVENDWLISEQDEPEPHEP